MSDFDPLAILCALERHRVAYVLIGDLAGVLRGTDLTADTVEITPSLKPENLQRLDRAFDELGVTNRRRAALLTIRAESSSFSISTPRGHVSLIATPTGTSGFDDLRRAAQREPLGQGIRAPVASIPDLLRCLSPADSHTERERRLRRLVDMERGLSPEP